MSATFAGFEHHEIAGWPVLLRRDARFKRFRLTMSLRRPLGADFAARSLLPSLLQHGTAVHPDRPALAQAKEMLYGAAVGPAVGRHGETAVLRLEGEAVAGEFLPGRPDQLAATLALLREYAVAPRLQGGAFPEALFERERAQAIAEARAVYDDKGAFARQRALSIACAGEPYGTPELGGEEALARTTADQPVAMLADFVRAGERLCMVSGAVPDDALRRLQPLLAALAGAPGVPAAPGRAGVAVPVPVPVPVAGAGARREREVAPMQQAKVVLVYRYDRPRSVEQHCAQQAFLSLWGGGPHSRLFREVRERRSLCYYAGAGGDPHKGVATVQVGCDAASVDAVVAAVEEERERLAAGRFDDAELQTTIQSIVGPLGAVGDTLGGAASFAAEQWVLGFDQDPAARQQSYAAVARDAVAAAAGALRLDLDYALVPGPPPGAASGAASSGASGGASGAGARSDR